MKNQIAVLFLTMILIGSCKTSTKSIIQKESKAKNIILLIGDGMGLAQLSASYYYLDQASNFSRFKHIGLHQNIPIGAKITDSASGATAFSTGYKSYNAAIGVDKDTIARKTILEWAAEKGKKTGVIATSSITHATPASFYAHVANRNSHEAIADDFLEAPIDFAAGGGFQFFAERTDKKDLINALTKKGYVVGTKGFAKRHDSQKKHAYFLAPDGLDSKVNGRDDFLPKSTHLAIDYLSEHKDGFFLMVEGSQIDWGGHSNETDFLIQEVLDFDLAVGKAMDFAEKDGNTLVIVTADHETGGFALSSAKVFGKDNYEGIQPTFSTGGHTASLIPVLAYGPGAERFMGVYQNNDIFQKMMDSYLGSGIKN